jgi:predicted transcriptional regulator
MNRTSLSLPDDVAFALKREARRRHTSVSAVAREALAERFGVGGTGPREVPFAAIGRSSDGRGAREAEEMLADIFEARDSRRRDERRGR